MRILGLDLSPRSCLAKILEWLGHLGIVPFELGYAASTANQCSEHQLCIPTALTDIADMGAQSLVLDTVMKDGEITPEMATALIIDRQTAWFLKTRRCGL